MTPLPKFKKAGLSILLISLVTAFGTTLGYLWNHSEPEKPLQNEAVKLQWDRWMGLRSVLEADVRSFKGTAGIIVKDLQTGWEFRLNKERKFPAASLVKLPLMLAVYDGANKAKYSLQDKLLLKGSCQVGGSGELKAMKPGCSFTVEELIGLMISASDNTATNLLIDKLGFRELNLWFSDFGLRDTNLGRFMMDFKYRQKGVENYTSPRDIALVLERLYQGDFLGRDFSEKCLMHLKSQKVNNRIPALLPPDTPVAHKTGLENRICHDAGIIYTPGGDFLLCVLTEDAPSHKNAKHFIARIASDVYAYFQDEDGDEGKDE